MSLVRGLICEVTLHRHGKVVLWALAAPALDVVQGRNKDFPYAEIPLANVTLAFGMTF